MALGFNQNSTVAGLGTIVTVAVPDAGIYFVAGTLTLPSIPTGAPLASAVVVIVNKNGSPVYTGSAGARGFHTDVSCAAADVITVVLSSALAQDNEPGAVKSTISLGLGE